MLTLNDGRSELWQWDTGRTLSVDADCSQVHFSNKVFGRSIDVDVVDGAAIIPDILLQTDKDLNVWAFVGTAENGYTKISKTFKVNRRNKPSDYVFTPVEQTTIAELSGRLDRIEESQDPDAIKNAVDDYLKQNPVEVPVQSVNGRTGAVELTAEDVGAIADETDPTVPEWAKAATKPSYTAEEVGALPTTYTPPDQTAEQVGADPAGTAASAVSQHNTDATSHNDLRLVLKGLSDRINVVLDSDDTTLDQMSEVVAYIKSNKSMIDAITTSKVSVADIVDNLATNVSNKPLSASQGVVIKTLIDALRNDKLDAAELTNAVNTALAQATASGAFDGADGQDGITPTIGENGNWYLGETDTGKPSRGETGSAGADGKSAYQYAQDGGYTGTEAEFAEKLASGYNFYIDLAGDAPNYTCQVAMDDIEAAYNAGYNLVCRCQLGAYTATLPLFVPMPDANVWLFSGSGALDEMGFGAQALTIAITANGVLAQLTGLATEDDKLPNPNALTFTGAVTGTYNGSAPLSVKIPSAVTDAHINSLIDTKLGVIENGSY